MLYVNNNGLTFTIIKVYLYLGKIQNIFLEIWSNVSCFIVNNVTYNQQS